MPEMASQMASCTAVEEQIAKASIERANPTIPRTTAILNDISLTCSP
mgnify:CR=1 FL=1